MTGSWGSRAGAAALAVVPIAFLALFFLLPLSGMLVRGFWPDGTLDLSGLQETLTRPRVHRVAWFTLWSAATATAMTTVLGLPVAYVLYRLGFPGRGALRALVVLPFVLPTVVVGTAFAGARPSLVALFAAHTFFNL
ncbi:MAG: iron ABC transporter permease, partial [Nocardioidaceae bacterium]